MRKQSWQKNLYIIGVAELIVIMGFSFAQPFMPLFIKKLHSGPGRRSLSRVSNLTLTLTCLPRVEGRAIPF